MSTPIYHKLPNELIQIVFEEYADPLEWSSIAFRDFLHRNLPLTWVCSSWRQISLHTPSLWDHICFDSGSDLIPGFLTIASVILKRSHSLPLWMKIQRDDIMDFNFLYEVVRPHLWRLQYLELDLFEIPTSPMLRAVKDQSSRLQTLIIVDSAGGVAVDPEDEVLSVPALSHPSIRSISLFMGWRVPRLPFRVADLDSLTLNMPTWAWTHLQTLLPQYPSIRSLYLEFNRTIMYRNDGSTFVVPTHSQFPPIPLPNLRLFQTDDPSICLDLETNRTSVLDLRDGHSQRHKSTWLGFRNCLVRDFTVLPRTELLRRLQANWASVRTLRLSMIKFDFPTTTVSWTASILACLSLVETLELCQCKGLQVILINLLTTRASSSIVASEKHSSNISSSPEIRSLSPAGPHEAGVACFPLLKKVVIAGLPSDIPTELAVLQTQRPTLEIVKLVVDRQQHMLESDNSRYA
ncbi:hypothetical protein DL93DRAFT_1511711 [Clavulina sp. PMI_390]|nr:hypothetical protein DL93DRAFT_1511711 [Clavulina sp. PMI_390]